MLHRIASHEVATNTLRIECAVLAISEAINIKLFIYDNMK